MKRATSIVALALAALISVYALFLRPKENSIPSPSPELLAAARPLDTYDFDLVLHPDSNQLGVTMHACFQNRWSETLPDIVLRTWAGAYASPETSPAASDELYNRCYPNGFSEGGFVLHDVTINEQRVTPTFDDAAHTVLRLPVTNFEPGQWCEVSLRMVLTVPDCLHRFGRSQGVWLLGNCLPILSVYEQGAWRTDAYAAIGDPFVSAVANYNLTLSLPERYTPFTSGIFEHANGLYTTTLHAVREAALLVYEQSVTASIQADGTRIVCIGRNKQQAHKPLQIAKEVLKYYNQTYGAYPYPVLTVAAVPFAFAGMEYPGMIWVGENLYGQGLDDALELTVAHEIAHQWFYALVGADQFRHPWQDEALCEHAMLHYVRARHGAGAYDALARLRIAAPMQENIREGITPGSPIDSFHDLEEYTTVVYGRGAAMLQALDVHTNGRVDDFLKEYVRRHAFALASRQDFEITLADVLKEDMRELLIDYLDTSM